MGKRTQQDRRLQLITPLGDDVLLVKGVHGVERLSALFEYNFELLSEDHEIKFADIVGQNVTLRIDMAGQEPRYVNGYVSQFRQAGAATVQGDDRHLARYQATVVPWLWFLTRTADCRIFQKKTVPDLIKEVCGEFGLTDIKTYLEGSYRTWDYCVQYRETTFNFLSRLMEQEGIYYYFEHENGKHQLALADSEGGHVPCPGYEQLRYMSGDSPGVPDYEHISEWVIGQQIQPGECTLTDYDYVDPGKSLLATKKAKRDHANAEFAIFDYPGEYSQLGDGETYAGVRLDEFQAQYEVGMGRSDARGIRCGYLFQMTDHPRKDQCRDYLVTSTVIDAAVDDYASGGDQSQTSLINCRFAAIDVKQQYRPARVTPKPVVQGPQTAVVVGKSGEEIWTDKHGCVKVHFHWDRHGKADDESSCWVRVSQAWAGKEWGAIHLPRIGQEVIVEFLEGDPDRPIITGRVYNGENQPPYGLPGEATKSAIRSNSSKGGGGFNEIRFEDKKGEEHILVRAEKDRHDRTKNDSYEFVGNDRHRIVKNDQFDDVTGDQHLKIGGDRNEKAEGTASLDVGMDIHQKAGMNFAIAATQTFEVKALSVRIEASTGIELKCGGCSLVLTPAAIFLVGGPLVNINSGSGPPVSPVGCSPEPPGETKEAIDSQPGSSSKPPKAPKPPKPTNFSPSASVLQQAADDGKPFCEECEKAKQQQQQQQQSQQQTQQSSQQQQVGGQQQSQTDQQQGEG